MRISWKFEVNTGESSLVQYRKWPFVLMLLVATGAAAYSILLPPGPDSAHFIDPSLKFVVVLIFLIIMLLKPTMALAKELVKENNNESKKLNINRKSVYLE